MVQSKFDLNKGARSGRRSDSSFGDAALGSVEEIKSSVSRTIVERPIESVLVVVLYY